MHACFLNVNCHMNRLFHLEQPAAQFTCILTLLLILTRSLAITKFNTNTNFTWYLSKNKVRWLDAIAQCQELNGELASVLSIKEHNHLVQLIRNDTVYKDGYWLGLYNKAMWQFDEQGKSLIDSNSTGGMEYVWYDKQPFEFGKNFTKPPWGDVPHYGVFCIEIQRDKWFDGDKSCCLEHCRMRYVCKISTAVFQKLNENTCKNFMLQLVTLSVLCGMLSLIIIGLLVWSRRCHSNQGSAPLTDCDTFNDNGGLIFNQL